MQPALGNDASISWLCLIRQAIESGDSRKRYGDERNWAHDCSTVCCDSFKPFEKSKDSCHRIPVVHWQLSVYSSNCNVQVPYWSHNWIHGELSGGGSLSHRYFQSIPYKWILQADFRSLWKVANSGQQGGTAEWHRLQEHFGGCKVLLRWWR